MKGNKFLSMLFCTGLLFFSCNRTDTSVAAGGKSGKAPGAGISADLPQQEYVQEMKNSTKTVRRKKIGSMEYSLSYCPKELMALRELHGQANAALLKETCTHYEDMEYFDFRITDTEVMGELIKAGLKDQKEYTARVTYCSFGIQKDMKLLMDGKDSVSCGLLHFERAYDVAPEIRFVLAFPKKEVSLDKDITFVFNDNIFNKGIIKLSFNKNSLSNLPKPKVL